MKKHFLNKWNVVLGAASVLLAGCHTTKSAVKESGDPVMVKYGAPAEVIAMYGVSVDYDVNDWFAPADTASTVQDTAQTAKPRPVMTKYGIPAPLDFIQ